MSPKAQKDWFRRRTWTESDRQDFEATLSRARSPGRAQYLRIQAWHLAESDAPALLRAALELLGRVLRDHPDDVVQRAPALQQKADCLWRLGDISAAIEAYRETFRAEETKPTILTGAWLEFCMRVVREGKADLYGEVEELLERRRAQAPSSLAFPVQKYQFHLVRAIIAQESGHRDTAVEHARLALDAAGQRHSNFRYHRDLGLVGKPEPKLHDTILRLAGAPNS